MSSKTEDLAALNAYTEGKMKRYNLLFAVNGGAFVVAKLLFGDSLNSARVGALNIQSLAIGMSIFSILMCYDIWQFASMMRDNYFPNAFRPAGKIVLGVIGALLVLGWLLAAFGGSR
jgi:hypothetical protein